MQPNRMERLWPQLKPKVLARWPQLNPDDLEVKTFDFNQVVYAVRKKYHPGRSNLTFEGEIKDWLVQAITQLEETDGIRRSPDARRGEGGRGKIWLTGTKGILLKSTRSFIH